MAFDEYIMMHQQCLLICGYTFFLRQTAFIEMVIDGKCYFWVSTNSNRIELFYFDNNFRRIAQYPQRTILFDRAVDRHRN